MSYTIGGINKTLIQLGTKVIIRHFFGKGGETMGESQDSLTKVVGDIQELIVRIHGVPMEQQQVGHVESAIAKLQGATDFLSKAINEAQPETNEQTKESNPPA